MEKRNWKKREIAIKKIEKNWNFEKKIESCFLKVFEHDVEFHRNDEYWKTDWFRIMFRFPFRILCVFVACHFNLPYWYVTNQDNFGIIFKHC